jgi:hypothetical protein
MVQVNREPIVRPLALIFILAPAAAFVVGPGGGQPSGLESEAHREDGSYGGSTHVSKRT